MLSPKSMKSGSCHRSMGPCWGGASQNRWFFIHFWETRENLRFFWKKSDFRWGMEYISFFTKKCEFFSKNGNIQGLWIQPTFGVKYFQIDFRWGMEYLFEKVKKTWFLQNPKRVDRSIEPPYEKIFWHGFWKKIQENPDQFWPFLKKWFFSKKLHYRVAIEGPEESKSMVWGVPGEGPPSCWGVPWQRQGPDFMDLGWDQGFQRFGQLFGGPKYPI